MLHGVAHKIHRFLHHIVVRVIIRNAVYGFDIYYEIIAADGKVNEAVAGKFVGIAKFNR